MRFISLIGVASAHRGRGETGNLSARRSKYSESVSSAVAAFSRQQSLRRRLRLVALDVDLVFTRLRLGEIVRRLHSDPAFRR